MSSPTPKELSWSERLDWLRLIRSENVGPITFRQLLVRYGSARAALEALPELTRRSGRKRSLKICRPETAEAEIEALGRAGARLVGFCEASYPPALAALEEAPPLLSLIGRQDLAARPGIAVVGARNASANGRRFAQTIATDLARAGLLVVSGLARGIDAAAHKGALADGTAAVVAGGVDVVYPKENQALYDEIARAGLILSEMPPGTQPQASHFPRRNRIISGMSLGVVVVEAAPRSGSLITARLAGEQGRDLFAVPGSPLDPRAAGCNGLIREGATLVRSAEDVLEGLSPLLASPAMGAAARQRQLIPAVSPGVGRTSESVEETSGETQADSDDRARAAVRALLGPSAVSVDELVRECQFSAPVVATILLELELTGQLERHPGGRVALRLGGD